MPKLNTTVDNIELKSNKITSTSSVAPNNWTDAHYFSAKALLDVMHPIGSILTTATKTNPSATLGGEWTLVDKAFKSAHIILDSSCWNATNATLDFSENTTTVSLVDHTVNMRLKVVTTTQLTDSTVTLGTLNFEKFGIDRLHYANLLCTSSSDGGNCVIIHNVAYDTGVVTVHEVLNINDTHTMEAGQNFYLNLQQAVPHSLMLDEFCDKFYWKRTA